MKKRKKEKFENYLLNSDHFPEFKNLEEIKEFEESSSIEFINKPH